MQSGKKGNDYGNEDDASSHNEQNQRQTVHPAVFDPVATYVSDVFGNRIDADVNPFRILEHEASFAH
jgi:hypothetical protein